MARLFGTDGVRGVANRDLTAELAVDLSVAAAHVLAETGAFAGHRPTAVVGRDSRASGEFLEAAVVAGLASAGVDVARAGIIPTPAVAYLTAVRDADLGVVLSASHNPMPDNGIKFFSRGGHKLADGIEDAVEARLGEAWNRPTGSGVGRVTDDVAASEDYVTFLLSTLKGQQLDGVKVVVDCANGAASTVAASAFARAGADVITIHDAPDGLNINDNCGSTHMQSLRDEVLTNGAHLGIALDGDADRCLAVDASGELVDGDQILAILALALRSTGRLAHDSVVSTVMSNLGFRQAMQREGIAVIATAVGDRYVLEAMKSFGYTLGGEQSGHLVMSEFATTGDGLLTALHLTSQLAASGRTLADLAGVMHRYPQVLVNVPDVDRMRVDAPAIAAAVAEEERALGDHGRVLLRPSGTEPLVRVMVEADTVERAQAVADRLASVVRQTIG
ncbi:MAG TPA: phosphoglucosamine mutase [Actinomycetes bacterium]|nr:phosphoglucosamine mutase [Actinomycetes bacterium]